MVMMLTWLPLISPGQPADSLERVLAGKNISLKERMNLHRELALLYINKNTSRSISLANEGIRMAREMKDAAAEASLYYSLGAAHYRNGAYDSAGFNLDMALTAARKLSEGNLEASVYETYGKLYRKQGRYSEALDHYLKAVRIYEQTGNTQALGAACAGIGGVYQLMKNYDQALAYLEDAEKLALQSNDKTGLARIYISLSGIYSRQGKDKDKCLYYAKEAAKICHETGDYFNENEALQTIAHVYFLHDDYENAWNYAVQAVRQADTLGNASLMAYSLIIVSNVQYHRGEYGKAIEAAYNTLKADSTDVNLAMNAYANLAKAYARTGRPDSTEFYMERYHEVLAEYSNTEYQNSLSGLKVEYEAEKKELRIEALEKQRQLHTWLGIAVAILLLISLAFAVIRYRLAVSRRKLAEEAMQRLEREKQLVAVQAALDGEAAERARLAKDLHDGLGSMLSAVKFNLPQVGGKAVPEAVDVSRFQTALGMLDESIQELRRVAHHMMPESLLRYGLKVSLSDFCASIPIARFHYFGDEARLPGKLETMVYRCIHELVNNALRHAGAAQINVQLVQEDNRLSFTVQDNGRGFDPGTVKEGMGLQNVRQRVAAFPGKLDIYSSAQGTEIHVELELTKTGSHDQGSHC